MALTFIVTNAGRAALVNAANTGTAPVTIAEVGLTATAVTPDVTTAALPGEFKRLATLSGDVVADDTIHLIVRDETGDVFTVRSLAMYLADGTLFGIYGQAAVLIEKSAQAMMLLGIDVKFEDIAAATITFGDANFLNPPATTEQIGVVELATLAEAIAGLDTSRVPAAKMVKDAVNSWLDARFGASNAGIWHPGNDGAGSGLDADLLDGQQGSYYSNITARLGYTPVQQGTGNGQLGNSIKIGWSGSRVKATVDVSDQGNIVTDGWLVSGTLPITGLSMGRGGFALWGPDNDGAGSGLDADLLDGQDGSYYSNITARLGYTPANKAGDTFTGTVSISSSAPRLSFNETDTGKQWNWVLDGSSFSLREDSLAGANTRILFEPGSPRLTLGTALSWGSDNVWHSGNDGAGSGLDADLLDGQDGSYYSNIIARLGYSPVNKAGDTMTNTLTLPSVIISGTSGTNGLSGGNGDGASYSLYNLVVNAHWGVALKTYDGSVNGFYDARAGRWDVKAGYRINGVDVWHPGNDGSGSGLDADLLDGQQGSYYADVIGRLGFWPVRQGTGVGQGTNVVHIGWSGSRLKATVDASDQGNIVFDAHISDVWRASNDGSGSGLDADLLDGQQGSFYTDIAARMGVAGSAPIYATRAWVNFNGTGTVSINGAGNVSSITDNGVGRYTVNFIVAMPDTLYAVNVTRNAGAVTLPNDDAVTTIGSFSTTGFAIYSNAGSLDAYVDANPICCTIVR